MHRQGSVSVFVDHQLRFRFRSLSTWLNPSSSTRVTRLIPVLISPFFDGKFNLEAHDNSDFEEIVRTLAPDHYESLVLHSLLPTRQISLGPKLRSL